MAKHKSNKDDFIKTFVNQMYGILIGIGIGSILFGSDFDISKWFDIIMVIFATTIVLIYWWDWIEYIEDAVVSTKSELIIDFAILISLEMLFVYYNRPIYLAISLVLISIFDLIWVINHIRYNKTHRKEYKSNACNRKWIIEKIISITIYLSLLAVVIFILPRLNNNLYEIFTVIIFIVSFFLVRKHSFKQVLKSSIYVVRKAGDLDASDILRINNSYFNEGSLKLIKKYTIKELVKLINEKRIEVAIDSEGSLVGYLVITPNGALNYLKDTIFKDETLKDKMKKQEHVLIEQIVVEKEYAREGIGSLLIGTLLSNNKNIILSYVSIEPYNNEGSMYFHIKSGFEHIGDYRIDEFADRKNYLSYLYMYSALYI